MLASLQPHPAEACSDTEAEERALKEERVSCVGNSASLEHEWDGLQPAESLPCTDESLQYQLTRDAALLTTPAGEFNVTAKFGVR